MLRNTQDDAIAPGVIDPRSETPSTNGRFPMEFNTSIHAKHIHAIHCRAIFKEYLVGYIQLHASFIQRNGYMDDLACFTNTVLTKYKKYAFSGNRPGFRVWFANMTGQSENVEKFVLELMLEY